MAVRQVSAREAVAGIPDGASVALGRPAALALVAELARQGRRELRLVGVPTGGRAVEQLIAAGCAASLECSGVDLGEDGQAPALLAQETSHTLGAAIVDQQAGAGGNDAGGQFTIETFAEVFVERLVKAELILREIGEPLLEI